MNMVYWIIGYCNKQTPSMIRWPGLGTEKFKSEFKLHAIKYLQLLVLYQQNKWYWPSKDLPNSKYSHMMMLILPNYHQDLLIIMKQNKFRMKEAQYQLFLWIFFTKMWIWINIRTYGEFLGVNAISVSYQLWTTLSQSP